MVLIVDAFLDTVGGFSFLNHFKIHPVGDRSELKMHVSIGAIIIKFSLVSAG